MLQSVNVVLLLIMCTAWAAGFVFVKFEEGGFPPLLIAACRSLLAAAGMLAFCAVSRQALRPTFRRWPQMLLLGALGPAWLWGSVAIGEQHVGAGLASVMVCVVPVSVLIFTAVPPISRRVAWPAWVGAAIATSGIVLVIGPDRLIDHQSTLFGVSIIGAGFAVFGLYCVLGEHLTKGLQPAPVAAASMLCATVILWALSFVVESPLDARPTRADWIDMLVLGLACSAVPNLIIFVIIKRAGAQFAGLYGYVLPVIGVVMAAIVFREIPRWTFYAGMPVAFAGMALLQWSQTRRASTPDSP